MSKININSNLYLGSNELNQMIDFLSDKRLLKMIINNGVSLKIPTSLQVIAGSNNNVSILAGSGLDADFNVIEIKQDLINHLAVPNDSSDYYVSIKHAFSSVENGLVNVQSDGKVNGVGTEFKKVLRGMPINAVKIRFPESTINTGDYEVLTVDSDSVIFLNSLSISSESNLKYQVVGCFTPGISIPEQNKLVYSYDSYIIELRTIFATGYTDALLLAKVRNSGGVISVNDMRSTNKLSLI